MKKIFQRLILYAAFLTACGSVRAQLQVNIVLVPPYPVSIADFQSQPERTIINIINNNPNNQAFSVQLRATIKGDNGITMATKPNFRSPSPVQVPFGAYRLSATEIGQLFDINSFDVTGISKRELIRLNGLPEGNYQMCVRLHDYNSNQPLSEDEPAGCSNFFTVAALEPPMLIRPFFGEEVKVTEPQNIIFTWSTPAGAPPSTQYVVRIVEMFNANGNPNDAILSSGGRVFFEREVMGNALLYGPSELPLVPGRNYAVMVTAVDPYRKLNFRNNGNSEASMFTYGEKTAPPAVTSIIPVKRPADKFTSTIKTSSVSGKVVWSFKKAEQDFSPPPADKTNVDAMVVKTSSAFKVESAKAAIDPNYASTAEYKSAAPKMAAIALASDKKTYGEIEDGLADIYGAGELLEERDLKFDRNPGSEVHPLEGATILLKAVIEKSGEKRSSMEVAAVTPPPALSKMLGVASYAATPAVYTLTPASSANEELIGSGTSDADGNFTIHFIDPKYQNITKFGQVHVIVKHKDFEETDKYLSTRDGASDVFDLGTLQVAAKTYRFTPYVNFAAKSATNFSIELYCPTKWYNEHSFARFTGNKKGAPGEKTFAGKSYTRIAQLEPGETVNRLFYQHNMADAMLVTIHGEGIETFTTYVAAFPKLMSRIFTVAGERRTEEVDGSRAVISVKKWYDVKKAYPYVYGQVQVNKGDGILPVAGATVTLKYDESQVKEQAQEIIDEYGESGSVKKSTSKAAAPSSGTATPVSSFSKVGPVHYAAAEILATLTPYTAVTDSSGRYRIDNLPLLSGGSFTITVTTSTSMKSEKTFAPAKRDDSVAVDFQLNADVVTITGIVVDEKGDPIPMANARWKSGGSPVTATSAGLVTLKNVPGSDSLILYRFGYVTKTIEVVVKKPKESKSKGSDSEKVSEWSDMLSVQPSVINALASSSFSPDVLGYAVDKTASSGTAYTSLPKSAKADVFSPVYSSLIGADEINTGFNDLGRFGYLEKASSKILFHITDSSTKSAISNAIIRIDSATFTTDASGKYLYTGGTGSTSFTVQGPTGSEYVGAYGELTGVAADGSVTNVDVRLLKGIKVTGKVTSKGTGLKAADVYIDGKEFIAAKTQSDGSYSLNVPKGEQTLKASLSGYTGKAVNREVSAPVVVNFELEDGGGKNISKLLGFDIELESRVPDGAGEKWTGSFIKLKKNDAFSTTVSRIKFTDVKVSFDGSGNAVANGDSVVTDVTQIPLKLFDFVPLKMIGKPLIVVRKSVDGKGRLAGQLQLSLESFGSGGGAVFDNTLKPYLAAYSTTSPADINVFTSDGSIPYDLNFGLAYAKDEVKKAADKSISDMQERVNKAKGDAKAELEKQLSDLKSRAAAGSLQSLGLSVYGFKGEVDLTKCKIDKSGLTLSGFIALPDIPVVGPVVFNMDRLTIGSDFSIRDVAVKSDVTIKVTIASWSGEINNVGFDMNGFKVGGKMEVEVPKSPKSVLSFANLSLATDRIFGGTFGLPSTGLNIFDVVFMKPGNAPITFGEVGNSGIYKIGGSGRFSFGKLLKDSLTVPYFQVQTDGKFAVEVPLNVAMNVGFAKLNLNSITFNALSSVPQVDVNGEFRADVKLIKFTAGNIHFKPGSGGPAVTVDKIGLGLDIPGCRAEAYVDMKDNGFAGGGALAILSTPVKASIDFHYFKVSDTVDLGAAFSASVKIPIGAVTINRVGGGFRYRSKPEFFSVTIEGGASITGLDAAVDLDPIRVTVESGPKIIGEAHLRVAKLDIAKAMLVIDIPNEYFAAGISAEFEPIPDVAKAHIEGDFILSAKKDDTYFFFGCGMKVDLLGGLVSSEGVFAIGAGVKDAQTRDKISYYMHDAPSEYLSGGTFSGIYVRAQAKAGVPESAAPGLDAGIASINLWLYTESDSYFMVNFRNGNFALSSRMLFSGGVRGCLVKMCATASARACVALSGGFNDADGWTFDASASGQGMLGIGCDCGCNDICFYKGVIPCGGKICVGAGAHIRYASRRGGIQEMSMYLGSTSECVGF